VVRFCLGCPERVAFSIRSERQRDCSLIVVSGWLSRADIASHAQGARSHSPIFYAYTTTMSGILSRVRLALGKLHPPGFLRADRISTAPANGNQAAQPPTPAPEGTIPFMVDGETHQTWYRVFGDLASSKSVPLVVIHGGKRSPCGPTLWGQPYVSILRSDVIYFPPPLLHLFRPLASADNVCLSMSPLLV